MRGNRLCDHVTVVTAETGRVRPQFPNERGTRYICPLYLRLGGPKLAIKIGQEFICDAIGETPIRAAMKAAAIGAALAQFLQERIDAGNGLGDVQAFLELFAEHTAFWLEQHRNEGDKP